MGSEMPMSTTKPIVLRQHIWSSESPPETEILSLSLGDEETSYTIILEEKGLKIASGDASQSEACATIHTRNGSVCIEPIKPSVSVQSAAPGFASANGIMNLQVTDINRRVYYQLHPGEYISIGRFTISIVPEEHCSVPVSPSGYESFRDRLSQNFDQDPLQSLRSATTPVQHPARSNSPSPLQIKPAMKRTERTMGSQALPSSFAEPIFSGVACNPSKEHGTEESDIRGEDSSVIEDPFVSAHEATTTLRLKNTNIVSNPQDNNARNSLVDITQKDMQVSNKQRPGTDQVCSSPETKITGTEVSYEGNSHEALGSESVVDDGLASEQTNFLEQDVITKSSCCSHKRQRLTTELEDLSEEETQQSMRSNIVAQSLEIKLNDSGKQKSFLQGVANIAASPGTNGGDCSNNEPSPVIAANRTTEHGAESAMTREPIPAHTAPESVTKMLFASSTSINGSRPVMKFLQQQGVEEVFDVTSCTTLCVGKNMEPKKTSKLIMAVLQGKSIITDDWVIRSASTGKLLNMQDFRAKDRAREAEWGIVLDEAIKQNQHTTPAPFDGWVVVFTSAAKKDAGVSAFNELKEIALYAGAKSCSTTLPKKPQKECPSTLLIACPNDPASVLLKGEWRCFSRDIIGLSSLRGKLNFDSDEFLVKSDLKTANGGIKRKKRQ